jgi:hypothetical protein
MCDQALVDNRLPHLEADRHNPPKMPTSGPSASDP